MAMLKTYWRIITFGLVCLASLGAGGWAYMDGSTVTERMAAIDRLRSEVEGAKRSPVNRAIIEQRKKEVADSNAQFEQAMSAALTLQKENAFESQLDADGKGAPVLRAPLVKNTLPKLVNSTAAIEFRDAYKKAVNQLSIRMKGRGKATNPEVADYEARMQQLKKRPSSDNKNPWGPTVAAEAEEQEKTGAKRSIAEILSAYAKARATEEIATNIHAWVDDRAFGRHPLAETEDAPSEVSIWQAQMALWIQQDIACALARVNEERVAKLKAQKQDDRCWVGHLPFKRLIALRIDNRLGKGGGSNQPRDGFSTSFTGIDNTSSMFMVPIRIDMVVEEAALMDIVSKVCGIGFYTPVGISYKTVKPNPLQDDFIYGEEPVIEVSLDMEAYYFRKVYDPWIPKDIKPILATPGAVDDAEAGGRG